jgi:acyl carrier protein phosphodiesterase
MNHLAHLVLAGPEEGHRLGALLGDHVKGRLALAEWPRTWADGIRLHRHIDSQCDRHPAVTGFLAEQRGPWRRYGGIILDVLFDAMLTRHWARFGPAPLAEFSQAVDALLVAKEDRLPPRLRLFAAWARQCSLWQRYDERAMLAEIFARIARRHGKPSPLGRGLELLDRDQARIERVFLELFVDLRADVARWRERNHLIDQ